MSDMVFISYYPLKQGLKRTLPGHHHRRRTGFISYYPLKQGLKRRTLGYVPVVAGIYILLSIKTRIET